MSKLYKELNYDTDRVMQPGDSLTSPDSQVSISANNDGTATLSVPGTTDLLAPVMVFDNFSKSVGYGPSFGPISKTIRLKGPCNVVITDGPTHVLYIPEDAEDPPSPCDGSGTPVWERYEFCIFLPGGSGPMIMHDGREFCLLQDLDTTNPSVSTWFATTSGTITITRGYAPDTKILATHDYVDTKIGDIDSVLDDINGEVI